MISIDAYSFLDLHNMNDYIFIYIENKFSRDVAAYFTYNTFFGTEAYLELLTKNESLVPNIASYQQL